MEQRKINQLNDAKTTVAYCEATTADTASITLFAPKVAANKGKIVIIEGYIQLSDTPITGVTTSVSDIRVASTQNVLPLGSALFAFGSMQTPKDTDLMAQAKLTPSYLQDLSKEICFNECQRIVTLANAHAADILPLSITALMLSDATAAVTLYGNVINSPRAAQISKAGAGEQAETLLASLMADDFTLQLDPLANILRYTNNYWWKNYKKAREVIDLGTTHTKLRVDCFDIENDPIKGVEVTMSQSGVVKYTGKTDTGGHLSIVKVQPGNYDITFAKTGFTTQVEADYHFAPGSEKAHHIVLQATGGGGGPASPLDPPGFVVQEFHIPAGGSVISPFGGPSTPPTFMVYMLCTNGTCIVCSTDLPANPCVAGHQLLIGVQFLGTVTALGIDLTKSNIQFTNATGNDITVRVGVPV